MLKVRLEIRDELRDHGAQLRDHGTRLEALERRNAEMELRLGSELVAVAHAVTEVRDLLRDRLDDRDRITDLERRVQSLEQRGTQGH